MLPSFLLWSIDDKVLSVQLHCFSDTSERAYATVANLRSKYERGLVDANLIAAKTRVAPLKKQVYLDWSYLERTSLQDSPLACRTR